MLNQIGWISGNLRINNIIIPWNNVTAELKEDGVVFYFSSYNMIPSSLKKTSDTTNCSWEPENKELAAAIKDFILRNPLSANLTHPFSDKEYYIVSQWYNYILSADKNHKLVISEKTDSNNPKWVLKFSEDGYIIFFSSNLEKKILDVINNRTENGTNIILYELKNNINNDNQKWKLEEDKNGDYYIVSKLSGKLLTAYYPNLEVVQHEKQETYIQKWKFVAA